MAIKVIYTLTFNPAIDYIMNIGEFSFGETNRSSGEDMQFGGKGINVSIVLSNLGIKTVALGFIAGFTGEELNRSVLERGISADFIRLSSGRTRINVKLKSNEETEINAKGPEISDADIDRLYEKLGKLVSGDTLVLAGSVPGSLPQNVYEDIMHRFSGRGIRFVVDAAGELLLGSLKYRPFLIKPNLAELEGVSDRFLNTDDDIAEAAMKLKKEGAVNVLVSLGGDGALLIDEFGSLHRRYAIKDDVHSTFGAGDSMVAGFLAGVDCGYEYALTLGTAAGSATAFAPGLANKAEIMSVFREMQTV